MSIYSVAGSVLTGCYGVDGTSKTQAYDVTGEPIFPDAPDLPIPSGNLNASETVMLPDLYEPSKGFTCTGLAYDAENDQFLIGDIGKLLPSSGTIQSQIVRVTSDFSTVVSIIPVYSTFPSMGDIQGITFDADGTIWFCAPSENKVHHITTSGTEIGSFSITSPTGIAYSPGDDSLWVLNYQNKIQHVSKSGTVVESFDFAYSEALDQCFLDARRGFLYITAGTNYSSRNNIYLFNTVTHQQSITCTVDSYSVEGLWIGETEMVILNDGYYHSAFVPSNVANIYTLN